MAPHMALCSLHPEDVDMLARSQGFHILQSHLADHFAYDFCATHNSYDQRIQARCLVIRDILHALLVPIVELFDKAVAVAAKATQATRPEDFEFAYTGDARSAFIWLQCFLSSEREQTWCATRGCPACVVDHSLDSEFTIRLLYAACLLSDVHYPFTMEGPTLPNFTFFLDLLEGAIADDELYGDKFFDMIQPKAIATREGLEDLIHQTIELDGLLSQPTSPVVDGDSCNPVSPILVPTSGLPMTRLKRSRLAKRQLKLQAETEYYIEEILSQCWDALHPKADSVVEPATHNYNDILKGHALAVP